jgi:putative transposase
VSPTQHPSSRPHHSPRLQISIESLNSRFRRATSRRGHFPNEQAAMKVLYLTVQERRPNRSNPTGQINGWKSILNTLAMTYGDRLGLS